MAQSLENIRAFAFDIDGVMTQGGIFCDAAGNFLRMFDAKDGFAMRMAVMNGYPLGVITGASSETIRMRLAASGVKGEDIYLHSRDKTVDFLAFCDKYDLKPEDVMFFGDDLPDIPVMTMCGIGTAPSDAAPEVIEAADYVTEHPGGKGCVREGIERVMKSQGRWVFDVSAYKEKF